MKLIPLTLETAIDAADWRNKCMEMLRTPTESTKVSQVQFWSDLQKASSPHVYFQDEEGRLICGLTCISEADGHAEISLIVDPEWQGNGLGKECVSLLLDKAFLEYKLHMVYGECYECSGNFGFWEKQGIDGHVTLPHRKFWRDGGIAQYYDAKYFWWING